MIIEPSKYQTLRMLSTTEIFTSGAIKTSISSSLIQDLHISGLPAATANAVTPMNSIKRMSLAALSASQTGSKRSIMRQGMLQDTMHKIESV